MPIRSPRRARPTTPTSSDIIFISLTAIAPTGFVGSSTRAGSCSTSMILNGKSAKLSHARWSFGSRPTAAIRRLSSAVMPREWSVWRTASSVWQEKRCLSVWFIFDRLRLCLSGAAVVILIVSNLLNIKPIQDDILVSATNNVSLSNSSVEFWIFVNIELILLKYSLQFNFKSLISILYNIIQRK